MCPNLVKRVLSLIGITLLISSCNKDMELSEVQIDNSSLLEKQIIVLYGSLDALILPESNDYHAIPADPQNTLTASKVALGKLLYHETALGMNPQHAESEQTYSCASCHHAKAGFQSGILQGIGEGGSGFGLFGEGRTIDGDYEASEIDVQPIRTPTILNTAFQEVMLWNGQFGSKGVNKGTESSWTEATPKANNFLGYEGLETQAIAGLGVHRLKCEPDTIRNNAIYKAMFDEAFPEVSEAERYTDLYAGLAIAAFERTVLATEAPFQKWLKGDEYALTEDELLGGALFFGKAACNTCHNGPGLNGMSFHALGMRDFEDTRVFGSIDEATKNGRGGFTGRAEDMFRFKTPTLYNLKDVHFLGHGGSFNTIDAVIRYKNDASPENTNVPLSNIDPDFRPLGLTELEIRQLTAFIENALYDPKLQRYVPASLPSGNCFPVADALSKTQMGCE